MKSELDFKSILVTGAAGFIGANLVLKIIKEFKDIVVIGIDNMNDYYDVSLKEYRLNEIEKSCRYNASVSCTFIKGSIADKDFVDDIFKKYEPDIVVNLAAQAGVRYSITNPDAYIEANLIGFYNILEACRHSSCNVLFFFLQNLSCG